MTDILALRPFIPAKDFEVSKRFYQSLGFVISHQDAWIAGMKMGGQSFILQKFYVQEAAENMMIQILTRDADAWWSRIDGEKLVAEFGVKPPRAPAMQEWGLKVGFLFDPSGVLWHIAETAF